MDALLPALGNGMVNAANSYNHQYKKIAYKSPLLYQTAIAIKIQQSRPTKGYIGSI